MASLTTQMTVAGNLTRDPELRYTQTGQAVASFSIASTPRTYDKDKKEYVDGEAVFTNCVLWGKPAENLAASATKGSRVLASGSLKSRKWTDKENNEKTSTELVVDELGLSVQFASYTKEQAGSRPAGDPPADTGWATASTGDDIPF